MEIMIAIGLGVALEVASTLWLPLRRRHTGRESMLLHCAAQVCFWSVLLLESSQKGSPESWPGALALATGLTIGRSTMSAEFQRLAILRSHAGSSGSQEPKASSSPARTAWALCVTLAAGLAMWVWAQSDSAGLWGVLVAAALGLISALAVMAASQADSRLGAPG
jgi:hypothetical protein